MPNRLIREGIIDSTAVNALSFAAEVFYRRLMNVADDHGRFDGRTAVLRARLYPLKLDAAKEADVSGWLTECVQAGLIVRYEVDGKPFLEIGRFNQQVRSRSKYPPPSGPPPADAQQMLSKCEADQQQLRTYSETYSESYAETETDRSASRSDTPPTSAASDPSTKPTKRKQPAEVKGFAQFWDAYPRKTAKDAARKAFAKLGPSPELLAAMLAAVDRQRRWSGWTKNGGEYIPHPATWLNGGRWEDDVGPVSPAHPPSGPGYAPPPGAPYVPVIAPPMFTRPAAPANPSPKPTPEPHAEGSKF